MPITIKQNLLKPTLRTCKSFVDDLKNFTYTIVDNFKVDSAGEASTSVDNDVTDTIQSSATTYNEPQIIITSNDFVEAPMFSSLNTDIATVDAITGQLTKVSNGTATIVITVGGYSQPVDISVTSLSPASQIISSSFNSGTLGKDAVDNVDTKIVGKNQNDNGYIFTSQNHSTDTFVRNEDVWCYDYDLTCISPSNSNANNRKAGTLITPRHIANAAHYEYGIGTKVYFVSQDGNNTVYERTVVSKVRHPEYYQYFPHFPDITVYCLDNDLPTGSIASGGINPCKVLPSNYGDYLVEINKGRPPSLSLDQEEKALITDLYSLTTTYASFITPRDATRTLFYESKIGGDSGNPSFLILDLGNGPELVCLTFWTYGGAGTGTFITPQISDINAMIVTADSQAGNGGTGYTLTEADLSGFTSFT